MKKKKIKISHDLFTNTLALLEHLDTDYFEPEVMQVYGYVLKAFEKKKALVNLLYHHQQGCRCSFHGGYFKDYSDNNNENFYDDDFPFWNLFFFFAELCALLFFAFLYFSFVLNFYFDPYLRLDFFFTFYFDFFSYFYPFVFDFYIYFNLIVYNKSNAVGSARGAGGGFGHRLGAAESCK